jgi:hypothetical protein
VVKVSTVHDPVQQIVADRLLDSLDRLARRHRSLARHGGEDIGSPRALYVELIVGAVGQERAMVRGA